jgi:hypothetical protein
VPGWHEATQQLESEGKLNVVGIVQEQHSQRTRLFMQWKSMGWPVMVDSLNLLGVSAVPITLFLDEFGIIRSLRPQAEDLGTFLSTTYKAPSGVQTRSLVPNVHELRRKASEDKSQLRQLADASFLWERVPGLSNAMSILDWGWRTGRGMRVRTEVTEILRRRLRTGLKPWIRTRISISGAAESSCTVLDSTSLTRSMIGSMKLEPRSENGARSRSH